MDKIIHTFYPDRKENNESPLTEKEKEELKKRAHDFIMKKFDLLMEEHEAICFDYRVSEKNKCCYVYAVYM